MLKLEKVGIFYPIIILSVYPYIIARRVYNSHFAEYVWSSSARTAQDYFLIDKAVFFMIWTSIFLGIVFLCRKKRQRKMNFEVFYGLFIYMALVVLSTSLSVNKRLSLQGANEQFESMEILLSYGCCCLLCYIFFIDSGKNILFYRVAALTTIVMGIAGIVQFCEIHEKVYLTLYNSNYVGMMMSLLFPLNYMRLCALGKKTGEKWLYRLALIAGIILLFLCGSKTAGVVVIWGVILFVLMNFGKKSWILFLLCSMIAGVLILGYQAAGIVRTPNYGIADVRTNPNAVTFIRGDEQIDFQFEMPEEDSFYFQLTDGQGNPISYEKNIEETRYIPQDERYSDYQFTIVDYEDFYGFMVTVDGRDWYFAKNDEGSYCYVNGYERLDVYQLAATQGFRGREGFATNRGYIWSRTIPLLTKYLLTGSGPDTFALVFPQNDVGKYLTTDIPYKMIITKPHSLYLQIAVQTGILSLFAFLYFIVGVLRHLCLRQNGEGKLSIENTGFFVAILSYLLVGLFNDSNLCTAPLFWVIVGMALTLSKETSQVTEKQQKSPSRLRPATPTDAPYIHQIMCTVSEAMQNRTHFVCDSLDFVQRHIHDEGQCIVACNEQGKVVASLIVRFPGMAGDNLGREMDLTEEQLMCVAHMESAVVLPECRGAGLQQRMLVYAEEILSAQNYRYLMATVAPENTPSLHNLQKCGYKIVKTTEKYGGLCRHVLLKQIKA